MPSQPAVAVWDVDDSSQLPLLKSPPLQGKSKGAEVSTRSCYVSVRSLVRQNSCWLWSSSLRLPT